MNIVFTVGTAFLLGVGAGLIIQNEDWSSFLTSYIPALATLVAAFYGAKFAFEFQNQKELEEEQSHNLAAANKAIFTLSRMANSLFVYQRDFINPVRNKPGAFLELRPTANIEKEFIKLDIEPLHFLLDTDFRNLLSEIIIEYERYRLAIEVINLRSSLHIEEIQPALERACFKDDTTIMVTSEDLEKILGNRLYSMIRENTTEVIFHVDTTLESLKDVANRFKESVKTIYPDGKIIKFTLPNTQNSNV
ncbi:MAG TPA: hypothetical protein VGD04_02170 [Methylophilus sp.]